MLNYAPSFDKILLKISVIICQCNKNSCFENVALIMTSRSCSTVVDQNISQTAALQTKVILSFYLARSCFFKVSILSKTDLFSSYWGFKRILKPDVGYILTVRQRAILNRKVFFWNLPFHSGCYKQSHTLGK